MELIATLGVTLMVVLVAMFFRHEANNIQSEIANRNSESEEEEEMSRFTLKDNEKEYLQSRSENPRTTRPIARAYDPVYRATSYNRSPSDSSGTDFLIGYATGVPMPSAAGITGALLHSSPSSDSSSSSSSSDSWSGSSDSNYSSGGGFDSGSSFGD